MSQSKWYQKLKKNRTFSKLIQGNKFIEKNFKNIWKIVNDYQFGFHKKYLNIKQYHRIVDAVSEVLEVEYYCSAFLDVSQAVDNVWHEGLFHKIRDLSSSYVKSYLWKQKFLRQVPFLFFIYTICCIFAEHIPINDHCSWFNKSIAKSS